MANGVRKWKCIVLKGRVLFQVGKYRWGGCKTGDSVEIVIGAHSRGARVTYTACCTASDCHRTV